MVKCFSLWANFHAGLAYKLSATSKREVISIPRGWVSNFWWKHLFQRHLNRFHLPAAALFWLCYAAGLKMRCNKLESIQSCEFWQELNKTEGDQYDERAKDNMSLLPQPITCCWTCCLSAICHLMHTYTHTHTGAITTTQCHTHSDILSVAKPCALLFQSAYNVGMCMGVSIYAWPFVCTEKLCCSCVNSKCHSCHMQSEQAHRFMSATINVQTLKQN